MKDGRIAIPSEGIGGLDGQRSGHFGHCDLFTIVDVKDGKIEKVETVPNVAHSEGGCLVPVNLLASHNVNALVVSGMGMRPLQGFTDVKIAVFYEATSPFVQTVVDMLIAGELPQMEARNACGGH